MSKKKNKKATEDKFQFVEMNENDLEITKTIKLSEEVIEAARKEAEKEENHPLMEEAKQEAEKEENHPLMEVADDKISTETVSEREKRLKKKVHISFEMRVTIMVVCILLLFLSACLLILEVVRVGRNEVVTYSETSNVSYNVCLLPNEYYRQECLEEGMNYIPSLTNTIGAYFQYNVELSTDITYDLAYRVVAITKICDQKDPSKILYRSEETLINKTDVKDTNDLISIDADVSIDYQNYNRIVSEYQKRYALESSAEVELILFLDETTETRQVASIQIPLGNQNYEIHKNLISNKDREVVVDGDFWNAYNTTYAVIASMIILLSLILLYRTARFVLKVTSNHNKYQEKLSQILRDYDRIIVIARNGYESNIERKIVKVESFEELLDAQSTLQKPIIYSRVNDVKSEFIVEDETTLYKFVLKESNV